MSSRPHFQFQVLFTFNAENDDISFKKGKAGRKKPDRAGTSWEEGTAPRSGLLITLTLTVAKDVVYRVVPYGLGAHHHTSEHKGHLEVSALKRSVYLLEIVVSFFEGHISVTASQRSPSSITHRNSVLQASHYV